jgi:type II secretory pathway pseudopilin PulG
MKIKLVGWALAHRGNFGFSKTIVSGVRSEDRGFTLTEIILLIFLLSLFFIFLMIRAEPNPRRLRAYIIKQKAQFRSIDCALELFKSEFDSYPPSDALDEDGRPYCGAMKLSEAMMGWDLIGFHPDSIFNSAGTDSNGTLLYPDPNNLSKEAYSKNLNVRKGPCLPRENANAHRLKDLYRNVGPFDPNNYILCDVFERVKIHGKRKKIGMPILYYKADTSKTAHDVNDPDNPENVYDYRDNQALLALGVPGKPGQKHPLYEDPKIFYEITRNDRIASPSKPFRADTYILLSAGHDGLYGTEDDIANFDFRWRLK